jgi:GntR family transcriptional repressor for pyruvate dehydrogenase complex
MTDAAAVLRRVRTGRGALTRSASIANDIEALILRGDLPHGQRLPTEDELGEVLGVSRSVVRDAVRMLVARGLLEVRQGYGTLVAAPSDEAFSAALVGLLMRSDLTMGDVLEARAALETQLARLVAHSATEDDWQRMDDRLGELAAAVDAGDEESIETAHLNFHRAMYDALHRPALETLLSPMQRCILLTSPLLPPEDREAWLHAHREIVAALRKRKPAKAEEAMRAHFADLEAPRYDEWRRRPFHEVAVLPSSP